MKTSKKVIAMMLTIAMIWTVAGVSFAEEASQTVEPTMVEATAAPVVVVEATETPAQPQTAEPEVAAPVETEQQPSATPEATTPDATVIVEENTPQPTEDSDTAVTEQPATETPATETPATETPANTETPIATETPSVTETPAVDATTIPNVFISIRCTNAAPIYVGDTVKLTAEITGIDWTTCNLQWQYLAGDEWKNASGANDITFSYVLTEANMNTTWRLAVTIG